MAAHAKSFGYGRKFLICGIDNSGESFIGDYENDKLYFTFFSSPPDLADDDYSAIRDTASLFKSAYGW